jgi:acyl transferase domain-containing protein
VAEGRDAIGDFPSDRGWEALLGPDTAFPRRGGFVNGAGRFDAGLFGISPREALAMDPQQRLLLEVTWEALERAAIESGALRGTDGGVFFGVASTGYDQLVRPDPATAAPGGFGLTGGLGSVASGRVAYVLGLEGPAVSVDTACSSSLVALHLARQALLAGECSLALAGGITVMATPHLFAEFAAQGGLAPDGRCKAFGAGADGTGWAEGVGVLVVERLSDARRLGHRVWGVVRGSAVNQDGASNGLTAPNGGAQQRVIRRALAAAGLSPADVDAVEAHGTGTALGDPIEAGALLATYGRDRLDGDAPLWLGSVKSNIGHTQAAAGVAGVIKMVMALRRGVLPATLHADEPSPHVDWSSGAVSLLSSSRPWPGRGDRPRRAGVSSFGISGTNAHVILEDDPGDVEAFLPDPVGKPSRTPEPGEGGAGDAAVEDALPPEPATRVLPVLVSAASVEALAAQAGRWAERVQGDDGLGLTDLGWSAATTRAGLAHRAVVLAGDRAEAQRGLEALVAGQHPASVVTGRVAPGGVGFVFSGQGSQRPGMGRSLHAAFPLFAATFDDICARLDPELGEYSQRMPLRSVLFAEPGTPEAALADETVFAQAGLFAVGVALVRLLASFGIEPQIVLGHSVGEIAAAHIAGVLSLDDACRLVGARGRLMQSLPAPGAMVALDASESEAAALIADLAAGADPAGQAGGVDLGGGADPAGGGAGRVAVAAVNGVGATVVSGDAAAIEALARRWEGRGRRARRLRVSTGFHSPLVEPMLAELAGVAAGLDYQAPTLAVVSTLTGELIGEALCTPEHWVEQARQTVRFADAVRTAVAEGVTTLIELGPDGHLAAQAEADLGPDVAGVAVARAGRDEIAGFVGALATTWVRGTAVDWAPLFPGARVVDLPTYAFQRERYWPAVAAPSDRPAPGDPVALVASWRYRIGWKPLDLGPDAEPTSNGGGARGRWLLVTSAALAGDEVPAWCAQALTRIGAQVEPVPMAVPPDRSGMATQVRAAAAAGPIDGVLSLAGLAGVAATVVVAQALGDAGVDAPLWCLTRGAVATGRTDPELRPKQASVWGLGRVVGLERPERWGGLVDLPDQLDAAAASALGALLTGGAGGEDQLAIRPEGVLARRLVRPVAGADEQQRWTTTGTALVTGGTGALGAHVARWLATAGAERLVLTSRRGPDAPGATELVAELEALGPRVAVVACDVADRAALAEVLDQVPADQPLRTVVHAAGISLEGELAGLTVDELADVAAAKAIGARHLHEVTAEAGIELDAFVLFSSVAAVWGAGGQGAYAAANAFVDALAEQRRAAGLPATSIAWGPWAGGGMAAGEPGARLRRLGLRALPPELAIAALQQALDGDDGCSAIADLDWDRFAPSFAAARRRPLIEDLPEAARALSGAGPDDDETGGTTGRRPELVERLAGLDGDEQRQVLLDVVLTEVAVVLGHTGPAAVDPARAFKDLGFDSVTAVELRNRLTTVTGLRLPATLVFDHPSPAALGDELAIRLAPTTRSVAAEALTHLARLEALLPGAGAGVEGNGDDHDLAAVATNLRRLLARLTATTTTSPVDAAVADPDTPGAPQGVEEQLHAADDDELLAFIDREFGAP